MSQAIENVSRMFRGTEIFNYPQWIYEHLSFVFVIKKIMIRPKSRLRRHELLPERIYNSHYGNGVPAMFTS